MLVIQEEIMTEADINPIVHGRTQHLLKLGLAIAYAAICAAAETTLMRDSSGTMAAIVATIVFAPLVVVAILFGLWWRTADEFQKINEYKALAFAGVSGILYLLFLKMTAYVFPAANVVPSFAMAGIGLVLWLSNSRVNYVKAMKA
jgi:hypothetical protein